MTAPQSSVPARATSSALPCAILCGETLAPHSAHSMREALVSVACLVALTESDLGMVLGSDGGHPPLGRRLSSPSPFDRTRFLSRGAATGGGDGLSFSAYRLIVDAVRGRRCPRV